jgi:hypothetical protein
MLIKTLNVAKQSHAVPLTRRFSSRCFPPLRAQKKQDAQERREKASSDWWLTIFNGIVALFTALLFGFNILLWRAGERQYAAFSCSG